MAVDYTTTGLVAKLKRFGSVPTSQALFLAADFIALMNDELMNTLLPLIQRAKEDFFITSSDTAIVSGTAAYTIPSRAAGSQLQDIVIVDSNGNEQGMANLGAAGIKSQGGFATNDNFGFYVKDNKIVLFPTPTETGRSIRFKYVRRPNQLVPVSSAGLISSFNSGTRVITLSSAPSAFTTSKTYDLISNIPPFVSLGDDLAVTSIVGNLVTMTAALPSELANGMYLCEASESPIPQVPPEAHAIIAQLGAVKALEAMNDKNYKNAKTKADQMLSDFLDLISPRIDDSGEKVVNRGGIFDASAGGFGNRALW